MISMLPLAKFSRLHEGKGYRLAPQHRIVLATETPEPRLKQAVQSLFPEAPLDCVHQTSAWPFTLYCGLPGGRLPEPQLATKEELPPEGYRLQVRHTAIWLVASTAAGLFYVLQTLRQLTDHEQAIPGEQVISAVDLLDWPDVAFRCMNYDLRQTFSRPEKLVAYMDMLASLKTNAVLIEYEDKFPFERHRELRHPEHALTESRLAELKAAAKRNFIELVPLQQSFGHLEYILGREEYKHLRENEASTGELCPCRPGSFELIAGLLEEIALQHPDSRYLHLGCDEIYSLCECPQCQETYSGSRNLAFIDFTNRLIAYACVLGKRPIIWQDVLAACTDEELSLLDSRVTVMIWQYNGKNIGRLASELTNRLRRSGIQIFGAPAVRCFDRKDDQNYPLVDQRLSNIDQWIEASADLKLEGLVGTNWTAVFSLGVPYGIFETSWYTMAYFADRSWRRQRPAEDRFIDRFLHVFHGISPRTAKERAGDYSDEDYYTLMPLLLEVTHKNKDVASLIAAMLAFEAAADRSRTTHKYVYRWQLFSGKETEWRSLMNNYRITRMGLERSRLQMEEALRPFQPEDMALHYVLSRYYVHDYLEKHLYQSIGLHIPGQEG
jgi:hexosaminidase